MTSGVNVIYVYRDIQYMCRAHNQSGSSRTFLFLAPIHGRYSVRNLAFMNLMHTSGALFPKPCTRPNMCASFLIIMIYLTFKKGMHFRVHGSKNPCTRQQTHARYPHKNFKLNILSNNSHILGDRCPRISKVKNR